MFAPTVLCKAETFAALDADLLGGEQLGDLRFRGLLSAADWAKLPPEVRRRFASHLTHEGGNIVCERFGPFKILLGIRAVSGQTEMPVVGWRIGAINLPRALAPKSDTRERVGDDGRFHFDVSIALPIVGLLAHYRGWLKPKSEPVANRRPEIQKPGGWCRA